ncbi:MAG: hypothetical protein IJP64_03045 [Oscillospiraceae bacterium]|nr:hypothetical protein [Oscillospiraceae bacterium]
MNAVSLKAICAASVFYGVLLTLMPEGKEKRIASMCVTAALTLMLLGLCRSLGWESYAVSLAEAASASETIASDAETQRRELNRLVIERACEEYIMDKAAELSLHIHSVSVSARWSREEVWVPERVKIALAADGDGRERLSSLIEAELGIPERMQEWNLEGTEG